MTNAPGTKRSAPRSMALLVPTWGFRFVSQFLEFNLPMLLAPGNLPAVARELPTRVILLSREADAPLIHAHPMWQRLLRVCPTEMRLIDDLITNSNHTATITLAFARAIKSCGEAITDTAFILWMSDYLVADGSLRTVVQRFMDGASAIFAGNFQIVAEDAIPSLRRAVAPDGSSIALSSRELLSWSLAHLHPATAANIVNFGLIHNTHINRLFWRVDKETLIGRFYLMHPIGIRSEVQDFVVGSSFDYSFVPEMCPSGNIETITHSDDYLVVEVQKRNHELGNLLPGPILQHELAVELSKWTTAQHRKNAAQTVVYQAGESPAALQQVISEADAFVSGVDRLLAPAPQPHRDHPYWVGSIASNRASTGRALSAEDWRFLHENSLPRHRLARFLVRFCLSVFGTFPQLTPFHPRWPDYSLVYRVLEKAVASGRRVLLVADNPKVFAYYLTRAKGDVATLEMGRLLGSRAEVYRTLYGPLANSFEECFVLLHEDSLSRANELIYHVDGFLAPGGKLSIALINDRPMATCAAFASKFAQQSTCLLSPTYWVTETRYVTAGRIRWAAWRAMRYVSNIESDWGSSLQLFQLPLGLVSCLINFATRTRALPSSKILSIVLLTLGRSGREAESRCSPPETVQIRNRTSRQCDARLDMAQDESGLDAAELHAAGSAEVIARYDFVAKLLALSKDVAQYGCAHKIGSQMVSRKVTRLSVYDPNPRRISEVSHRLYRPGKFEAYVHNVLADRLPKAHDAIFSLDTLEYVAPGDDEDRYIRNLRRSLSRSQGILIFGLKTSGATNGAEHGGAVRSETASLVTATDGQLKGHAAANCDPNGNGPDLSRRKHGRTGAGVKALLESHFETVFLFSMVDCELHSGVNEAGDYLFALCSHGKSERS